ncbi:DUF1033 family protein [Jeotgalibacillus haloalkalitolerans]|uniref:DUF1033 family protein n=1 Tax=Jeotgalibacillus haloalkalitolerans TaxID=3104292 RepID=A0ABU5KKV3_9BACL|nr:DUF1033 family protein [Jeotgalibacillus sp. HH7-29]MDZ5711892.1 DUF1033 family protein [Jeotgalibacillus sp. HH7-29]
MWRIVQLKSDAEPWWFLEGWESDITVEWTFNTKHEALEFYRDKMHENLARYDHARVKRGTQAAFWNEDEFFFCEDCDEDLQVYHGYILFSQGEPYIRDKMTEEDKQFFEAIFSQKKEA